MRNLAPGLSQEYLEALRAYVTAPTEEGLMRAYDLGRSVLQQDGGVADLAIAHAWAQSAALGKLGSNREREKLTQRSADFLREAMTPVEMMLRGYQETNASLQELTTTLEQRVEDRTAALLESEQRFARFMHQLSGLAWVKDLEGRYVYVNDAAERAFRKPRAQLYGKTDDQLFPAEFAKQFRENDRRALASETGILTTEVLEHEDGLLHHSIVSKFPIANAEGRVEFVGGMAIDISDRVRAEEALRESEERFRLMADTAPVMIWLSDPDKLCTYFNKPWLAFTGRTLEQELGNGWAAGVHPDDLQRCLETYNRAFDLRQPFRMEYRLRRNDGSYAWVLDSGTPRGTSSGVFAGYIGSCIEITDRKLMEEALRESEERFRRLANTVPAFVWTAAADGSITYANEKWYAYSGLTPEQTRGWEWAVAIHPEDRDHCLAAWTKATQEGTPYDQEVRNRAADGTYRWFLARAVPVRDAQGRLTGWFGTSTDIESQKQAEEVLRESGRWLQELADAMPQIIWTAKADGAFDYFNRRWYEYTGLPKFPARIEAWKPVLHPEDAQEFEDRWLEAIQTGEPYQLECRLLHHKTGAYRWHLCRGLATRNRFGQILHWHGTCTDIDQQKQTEEALMLADRRKDEFLAVLSHELRNPLGPIRNALQIFRMSKLDDPDLLEAREVIDRQVQQIAGIVDDLLDVFRIVHEKMRLEMEPLDVAQLVRRTVDDYRSLLESSRVTLELDVVDEPV